MTGLRPGHGRSSLNATGPNAVNPRRVRNDRARPTHTTRFVALAALGVLLGGAAGRSPGATVPVPDPAPVLHGNHGPGGCPCGMDCGTRCCCKPRAAKVGRTSKTDRPAAAAPRRAAPVRSNVPCLNAAPCGGGTAVPSSRPTLTQPFDPAALAATAAARVEPAGDRLVPSGPADGPEPVPSRSDEPPEPAPREG